MINKLTKLLPGSLPPPKRVKANPPHMYGYIIPLVGSLFAGLVSYEVNKHFPKIDSPLKNNPVLIEAIINNYFNR